MINGYRRYQGTCVSHLESEVGALTIELRLDVTVKMSHHEKLAQIEYTGPQEDRLVENCLWFATANKRRVGREDGRRDIVDAADSSLKKARIAKDVDVLAFTHVFG